MHGAMWNYDPEVDIPNARSETALQLACRKGDVNIVRRLLQVYELRHSSGRDDPIRHHDEVHKKYPWSL